MSATRLPAARIVDPVRSGMDEVGSARDRRRQIAAARRGGGAQPGRARRREGRSTAAGMHDHSRAWSTRACFIGEPGGEHRETLASASRAAAAGGVTSFVMMPDTDPVIDDVALVEFVLRAARDTAIVNVYPAGGDHARASQGARDDRVRPVARGRRGGLHRGPQRACATRWCMRRALTYARDFGAGASRTKTQDPRPRRRRRHERGAVRHAGSGLAGIPREAEIIPLERDLRSRALTGGDYHAAKISTALSCAAIAGAKKRRAQR